MFADPQSVTISGVTTSLPKTSSGKNQGEYTSSDGTIQTVASHTYGKRTRRAFRLNHSKIAPDTLFPDQNTKHTASVYLVIDSGPGYTATEQKDLAVGMMAQLTASTNALLVKFTGGES